MCLNWKYYCSWCLEEVLCLSSKVRCNDGGDTQKSYLVEEVDLGDSIGDIPGVPHQNNYQLHKRIHCVIAFCTRHS